MRTSVLYLSAFVFLVAAAVAYGQSDPAPIPLLSPLKAPETLTDCGSRHTRFAVKLDNHPFKTVPPQPGMARVYLITETQPIRWNHTPITKIGMDGRWVGANQTASYIPLDVQPGKHTFCAMIGRHGLLRNLSPQVALVSLNVFADHTYYLWNYSMGAGDSFTLSPVNPDQAAMLMEAMPESVSHPK